MPHFRYEAAIGKKLILNRRQPGVDNQKNLTKYTILDLCVFMFGRFLSSEIHISLFIHCTHTRTEKGKNQKITDTKITPARAYKAFSAL